MGKGNGVAPRTGEIRLTDGWRESGDDAEGGAAGLLLGLGFGGFCASEARCGRKGRLVSSGAMFGLGELGGLWVRATVEEISGRVVYGGL